TFGVRHLQRSARWVVDDLQQLGGTVGPLLRLGGNDRQTAALPVPPELHRELVNLSSSFEGGTDGGDGTVAGPNERSNVAVGQFGTPPQLPCDQRPLLLAGELTTVAVELQAQVAAGAFVVAVNGADRVAAKAKLLGDGQPLKAVDDLAVLVLDNGRV